MPTTSNTVEVQNLTSRYGSFTAVEDLTFHVRAGESSTHCWAPTGRARPPPSKPSRDIAARPKEQSQCSAAHLRIALPCVREWG